MDPTQPYHEKALLSAVAAADASAFQRVFEQYRRKVYYIAYRLLHTETAAEDVLQEIFIKVWVNREKLPEINNFNSYINTLTHHHISNALRRKAYEQSFLLEALHEGDQWNDQLLEQLDFNELEELLARAVSQLPPQQKKVFQLGRLQGYKHEEIAGKLGISKETVKKHMMEAVRHLRDFFKNKDHAALNIILALFLH